MRPRLKGYNTFPEVLQRESMFEFLQMEVKDHLFEVNVASSISARESLTSYIASPLNGCTPCGRNNLMHMLV